MEAEQDNNPSTDQTLTRPPPQLITLRPFNPSDSDIDDLIALAADDRINRFLRRGAFSGRFLHTHVLPHPWYRAICLSGGRPVGSIALRPEGSGNRGNRIVSIGYRLAVEFWGRGVATEAVRMATATAFEEWVDLERVEAMADVENPASQRVLEKAGFVREAVLRKYLVLKGGIRNMVMYGLVSADRTPRGCLVRQI